MNTMVNFFGLISIPVIMLVFISLHIIHSIIVYVKNCLDTYDSDFAIIRNIIFLVGIYACTVIFYSWNTAFELLLAEMFIFLALGLIALAIFIVAYVGYALFAIAEYLILEVDWCDFFYNIFIAPIIAFLCFVSPSFRIKREARIKAEAEEAARMKAWEEYQQASYDEHY